MLGATSDRRVTADNARGLLVTLLGEFVLPNGGSVWTQTLVESMEAVGIQDKTTRQALARLADRGWLNRTKEGRRTRWHLTGLSRGLLESGAERIYGFGRAPRAWDGRWLVLLASLSDRDESRRYRLTTGLTWAGFGSLGQGTWLSPWVEHEAAAIDVLTEIDVPGATTFVAEVGRLGAGADLVARAWDLDGLRAHYDDFLAATRDLAGSSSPVPALATLVHSWRRFPFLDPELPSALLPDGWPAEAAVERFSTLRGELLADATSRWLAVDARYGATVA